MIRNRNQACTPLPAAFHTYTQHMQEIKFTPIHTQAFPRPTTGALVLDGSYFSSGDPVHCCRQGGPSRGRRRLFPASASAVPGSCQPPAEEAAADSRWRRVGIRRVWVIRQARITGRVWVIWRALISRRVWIIRRARIIGRVRVIRWARTTGRARVIRRALIIRWAGVIRGRRLRLLSLYSGTALTIRRGRWAVVQHRPGRPRCKRRAGGALTALIRRGRGAVIRDHSGRPRCKRRAGSALNILIGWGRGAVIRGHSRGPRREWRRAGLLWGVWFVRCVGRILLRCQSRWPGRERGAGGTVRGIIRPAGGLAWPLGPLRGSGR